MYLREMQKRIMRAAKQMYPALTFTWVANPDSYIYRETLHCEHGDTYVSAKDWYDDEMFLISIKHLNQKMFGWKESIENSLTKEEHMGEWWDTKECKSFMAAKAALIVEVEPANIPNQLRNFRLGASNQNLLTEAAKLIEDLTRKLESR